MYPKVSIITVCYNAGELIENTIKSVLGQTYENKEYIIIDGNSTDNTVSIINKYRDKIKYFLSEPDNGMYDAMNKGVKAATGDILYFLNSDDLFYDEYVIENIAKVFRKNNNVDLIYGPIIIKNPITNESFIQTYDYITKSYFINGAICQQAIFYKADIFKKCGQFNDTYKIVGDYEWVLRAFYRYNVKREYYGGTIAIFRKGGMSSCNRFSDLQNEERRKVMKEYFSKAEIYSYYLQNHPTYIFTYISNIIRKTR